MTKRVLSPAAFAQWHYKNDPTHVAFFCAETFQWLAREWSAGLRFFGPDVVIFSKPQEGVLPLGAGQQQPDPSATRPDTATPGY